MFKNIVNALKSPLDSSTMKENQNISESTNEKKRDPAFKKNSSFCILNNKEKNLQNPCTKKITESRGNKEFSRRKRQVIGSSDEGSQSENSDGSSDNSTNSKSSLACNMYKKAIKDLRHKPKKFKFIDFEKEKSRPALVDEKNYVDNCIIDSDAADDEGEENEEVNEYKGEEKNKIEKEERVGVGYEFSKNNEEIYKEFVDLEEECVEQLMRELESSPMKIFNEKHSTSETELESKPWLKAIPSDLLKSDFKEHSYQEQQIDDGQVLMSESRKPDTKNLSLSPSVDCNSSSPILWNAADKGSGAVDLTVQICNNEIKIPVKKIELTELKIDWLVGEVAKQYPIVESPDYCVTLRTKSNITISESDLLTTVVDETIEFVVTKWKMLPLNERYEKVCLKRNHADIGTELGSYTSFKHSIQPQVAQILKCSPSRRYTLSNLKLSSLSLAPICKAMKYESFIQVLNLSNNYFGDKGIELIVKIFDKCIIEELNLSGCSITSSGVYLFSDSLSKINDLSKNGLQVLNLSKNPITDDAVEAINNIMEQLPNLTVLNLDHCELETLISTKVFTNLIVTQGNNTVNTQTNLDIATTNS